MAYLVRAMLDTVAVRWKLREYLDTKGISTYALASEIGGKSNAVTLYRLNSPTRQPRQITFDVLEQIVVALRRLTGERVTADDLLEIT